MATSRTDAALSPNNPDRKGTGGQPSQPRDASAAITCSNMQALGATSKASTAIATAQSMGWLSNVGLLVDVLDLGAEKTAAVEDALRAASDEAAAEKAVTERAVEAARAKAAMETAAAKQKTVDRGVAAKAAKAILAKEATERAEGMAAWAAGMDGKIGAANSGQSMPAPKQADDYTNSWCHDWQPRLPARTLNTQTRANKRQGSRGRARPRRSDPTPGRLGGGLMPDF